MYRISTIEKRKEIYATLSYLPCELSRIVAEYGISASELIEEYANGYGSNYSVSWSSVIVQVVLIQNSPRKYHDIKISVGFHVALEKVFVGEPRTDDFVGMVEEYFGKYDGSYVAKTIRQMMDEVMEANFVYVN